MCRAFIKNRTFCPSFTIENIVQNVVSKSTVELRIQYANLVDEYKKWISERNVSNFRTGLEIDVKDTEDIWCKGLISDFSSQNQSLIMKVHYDGWSNIYDEFIPINSERIATRGFYTSRKGKLRRYSFVRDARNF